MQRNRWINGYWKALILLVPLYMVRVFSLEAGGGKTVYLTNIFEVLVLIGLMMIILKGDWVSRTNNFLIRMASYKNSILLIFFGVISSWAVNHFSISGLGIIKSWFVFPALFIWGLDLVFQDGEKRETVWKYWWISSWLISVISIGAFVFGMRTFDSRLAFPFNSPNYLAMYLAPGIIILAPLIFQSRKYLWPLLTIFLALALTQSYSALGALLVALFIGVAFNFGEKIKKRTIFIIIGAIILGVVISLLTQKGVNLVFSNGRSSWDSRQMIWRASEKIVADHWLMGIGPGSFQDEYLKYQKYFPPYLEWAVPHPHNLFLSFWLSGGLIGLIGFVYLGIVFLGKIKNQPISSKRFILMTLMLFWLINGLADTPYFKNDLSIFFWLTIWGSL